MLTDPLTGVFSRAPLEQQIKEEIDRLLRYRLPSSINLLDLYHDQSLDDAFGHLRGDQDRVGFARRLRSLLRASGLLFCSGGAKFMALLPNTTRNYAASLARRLLDSTRAAPSTGEPPLKLPVTMEVSSAPDDGQTPGALLEKVARRSYGGLRLRRGQVIHQDGPRPALAPLDEDSRLIERDEALLVLHQFFRELPQRQRGIFVNCRALGGRRTRFSAETGDPARLQGYRKAFAPAAPLMSAQGESDEVNGPGPGEPWSLQKIITQKVGETCLYTP